MTKQKVIKISLAELANSLYRSADSGDFVRENAATFSSIETPYGIDIAQVGRDVVTKLRSLEPNHPARAGLDIDKMERGIEYIVDERVSIMSRNLGQEYPVRTPYTVQVIIPGI